MQKDAVIGRYGRNVLASDALQVDAYSMTTLSKGNTNREDVVDYTSRKSIGVVHHGAFFSVYRGVDGATTIGTSMLSVGSTADGRYMMDMSIPTGRGSSVGATFTFDPKVFVNNMRYFGRMAQDVAAHPPRLSPVPDMPIPIFP